MLTDSELTELLLDSESDRVERKQSLGDAEKLREAICAYANDLPDHRKPGVIFVGVKDDGTPAATPITDALLLTLAGMRDDGSMVPLPSMTVQKRTLRGCELAVVVVEPQLAPPVRLRGRVWIRVGPRRAWASPEDERRLVERRRGRDLPFDVQPVPRATLSDLDLDFFRGRYLPKAVAPDVLEQNQRTVEDQLRSLKFLSPEGPPTLCGLLVLGTDAKAFSGGDYIQFVRFAGVEMTDPVRDQKRCEGTLSQILDRIDVILDAHNEVETQIVGTPVEKRRHDYPPVALQQLVRNAVMHRSYEGTNAPIHVYWFEDRVEIQNPGGPYGAVTIENFGQPGVVDYRNSHLAEAMRILGYVQRFGVGIDLARKALSANGNPPLEFAVQPTHVLARVRRRA